MRSSQPMPGEPWPHDMRFTVDDRPNALLDLLWVREAYELRPVGEDLPPLLVETPDTVDDTSVSSSTRIEWEAEWPRVWRATAEHAGLEHDPAQFEKVRHTADGSPERADLLRLWAGPSWQDEIGASAFANATYAQWQKAGFDAHVKSRPMSLQASPERRDLAELASAWRRGLTKVVTIPCVGEYSRALSPSALLTTDATRADSSAYRRVLAAFR